MKRELDRLVVMKLNAEKEGKDAATKYGVQGYPTVLLLAPDGSEIDRIVGFSKPPEYLADLKRIRAGDTFQSARARLEGGDRNHALLERVAAGLVERGKPEEALSAITAFHGGAASCCAGAELQARGALQRRAYRAAERSLLRGEGERPTVPAEARAAELETLLARPDLASLQPEAVAKALHDARHADAGTLLAAIDLSQGGRKALLGGAELAWGTGHYERTAELARLALGDGSEETSAGPLGEAAWFLYTANVGLEDAERWARRAWEMDGDPGVGDTLARTLYRAGKRDEAVELQAKIVAAARGGEDESLEEYEKVLASMRAGEALDDSPSFERWPRLPKKS